MISKKKIIANQKNGKKSKGPVSIAGKSKVSMNA